REQAHARGGEGIETLLGVAAHLAGGAARGERGDGGGQDERDAGHRTRGSASRAAGASRARRGGRAARDGLAGIERAGGGTAGAQRSRSERPPFDGDGGSLRPGGERASVRWGR